MNAEQRAAVEHPGGPLLVLAGPGTGKTRVLIERVSHLVAERSVPVRRILALTFSRRAAEEMNHRVQRSLGSAAAGLEVRTFHSFALGVVRQNTRHLGLRAMPGILPTGAQWALVSELLLEEDPAAWGLPDGALSRPATVREVYDLLLRAQENLLAPEDLVALGEEYDRPYLARAAGLLRRYRAALGERGGIDYEGIVQRALQLFENDCPARSELQGRYDHVLVDEFQDTNRSQLQLLRRLMPGEGPDIFCVGDDAQSIYRFRGARIENIREFQREFPTARQLQLRVNYRSGANIISVAEEIIGADPDREGRWGRERQQVAASEPDSVLYHVATGPGEEAAWISARVRELVARGVPPEEIAILRRSLLDSGPLVEALTARGIAVDRPPERAAVSVRHLTTLLAATAGVEPGPDRAASALLSAPVGLPPGATRALRESAQASDRSVFGLIRSGDTPGGVSEAEMVTARKAVEAVDAAARIEDFSARLKTLWQSLPGVPRLFERHREDSSAAREVMDLSAFLRSAHAYAGLVNNPSVAGFLRVGEMLHDDSDTWAPGAPPVEGAVRLMTVHGSKGLEFDAVFVSGLTEDRFPSRARGARLADFGLFSERRPTPEEKLRRDHRSEERRLFYVAATRARRSLFLTGTGGAGSEEARPSPFLRDLEERLVELAAEPEPRRFWTSRPTAVEELRRETRDPDLEPGRRFAAARALLDLDDDPREWWPNRQYTTGSPQPAAERLEARSREVLDHLECPRRAFLGGLSEFAATGRRSDESGGGSMKFGSAFNSGLGRYLNGEFHSLEAALVAEVPNQRFGGRAVEEYWLREARKLARDCEAWAAKVRENLAASAAEFTVEVPAESGGHLVHGISGPVVEEGGERVVLKVRTGKGSITQAQAASDPGLALAVLGSESNEEVNAGANAGAKFVLVRDIKKSGLPGERKLNAAPENLEMIRAEVSTALRELAAGELPARPCDEGICSRCDFRQVCPAHPEEEPWGA